MSAQEALQTVGAAVEGYYAAASARTLALKLQVEMPIVEAAYQVLYNGRSASDVLHILLNRQRRSESEDALWH